MVSLNKLIKTTVGGCFLLAFSNYTLQYVLNRRLQKTKTYKKALKMFYDHPDAVQHLGEPIKEGSLKVTSDDKVKKFIVNLKGAKTKGQLDCEYTVKPDFTTEIRKLQVKFNNLPNQICVIHET